MYRGFTIKSRLIFVIAFLCMLLIGMGALGLTTLSGVNASLRAVSENRLVSMCNLDMMVRTLSRVRYAVAASVNESDAGRIAHELDLLKNDLAIGQTAWTAYNRGRMTPREKMETGRLGASYDKFFFGALEPMLATLKAGDRVAASSIVHGPMESLYLRVQEGLDALIAIQMDQGKREFEASQTHMNECGYWPSPLSLAA